METRTWPEYQIVYDPAIIDEIFNGSPPYNLKSQYDQLGIDEEGKYDIAASLGQELKKGGPRGSTFAIIVGSICATFVAKIRVGDGVKGKRSGYRVITLVIPWMEKALILGIKKHTRSDSDTTITKEERKKLQKIVKELDKQGKKEQAQKWPSTSKN